jgi:hypothetical protein
MGWVFGGFVGLVLGATIWGRRDRRRYRAPYWDRRRPGISFLRGVLLTLGGGVVGAGIGCLLG